MVRNEMFRWVDALARRRHDLLPPGDHVEDMAAYWEEFEAIEIDAEARSSAYFRYDHESGVATQVLRDPDSVDSWRIEGEVDRSASAEAGTACLHWVRAFSL